MHIVSQAKDQPGELYKLLDYLLTGFILLLAVVVYSSMLFFLKMCH